MKLRDWEALPQNMQTAEVRHYYDILRKKRVSLFFKRLFDIVVSLFMLVLLSPFFLVLSIIIKLDSPGPVFYRQERVTQYGRVFRIHKFRTMVQGADKGAHVTTNNDSRITRVGKAIRGLRLDELPQLLDILTGSVTFVGVRPESTKYVREYTDEMMATLLLPAGVTNLTSIYYKDEAKLLEDAQDADKIYVEEILPKKMSINLKGIEQFSFWADIAVLFMTVSAVLGKEYKNKYSQEEVPQLEKHVYEESAL